MRRGAIRRSALVRLAVVPGLVALNLSAPTEAVPHAGTRTGERVTAPGPASAGPATVPDLEEAGWLPVLDEEFEGDSLDESIWKVHDGPGRHGSGLNRPDAVQVEDGALTVTPYSEDTDGDGTLEHYTGGLQTGGAHGTWGGFTATYGYIEARVRLDSVRGTRSALWMLSETVHRSPWQDPVAAGPEIDLFEIRHPEDGDSDPADGRCDWQPLPRSCEEVAVSGTHWGGFDERHVNTRQVAAWDGPSPQGNFLTYGLLWTPDGYRMYRNGVEVYRGVEPGSFAPEFLILEIQQGPDLGEVPAGGYGPRASASPAMVVDHVRVWQRPVSDVSDRVIGVDEPLSVPFTVRGHHAASPGGVVTEPPGSVQVTATSSDQGVVRDDMLVVTGDGPDDPDGSFTNGAFDAPDGAGWDLPGGDGNAAHLDAARSHSPPRSLRLDHAGGRAEQTVTGLRPGTTYEVGVWHNLALEWDDLDDDGRVDPGEPFEPGGGKARFEWGVVDTDTSREGEQRIAAMPRRNGRQERERPRSVPRDRWTYDTIQFTTGPGTTEVTLFVDNGAYAGSDWDSQLWFDTVRLRPVVPPDRALSLVPEPGATGTTEVTLTATDEAGQVLGTDELAVTVGPSSFTNGGFEARPRGHGWDLSFGGAEVVVDDPFRPDHVLRLGAGRDGLAYQDVTGLRPNAEHVLALRARVEEEGGAVVAAVADHGSPVVSTTIGSTGWSATMVPFTTDASGSARIYLLDWDPGDGASLVDGLRVVPAGSGGSPGSSAGTAAPPPVEELGGQHLTSGAPRAVPFVAPGVTVTGVTSSNPHLLADAGVAVTSSGRRHLLGLSPRRGWSGEATVRLTYEDGAGTHVREVPVTVTDTHLVNPRFRQGSHGWQLTAGAAVADGGGRSGGGLVLDPDEASGASARQMMAGLHHGTEYVLGGWSRGDVRVTVRAVANGSGQMSPEESFEREHTVEWSSATWARHRLPVRTAACASCDAAGSHVGVEDGELRVSPGAKLEVLVEPAPGSAGPAAVDDLHLVRAPAASPPRDLSIHTSHSSFSWATRQPLHTGGLPAGSLWDDRVVEVASADPEVLAPEDVRVVVDHPHQRGSWAIETRTGGESPTTGRSWVVLTLTDPETGTSTRRAFRFTVSAGDSFDDGDFERSAHFADSGWEHAWLTDSVDIVGKQRWRHLAGYDPSGSVVGLDHPDAIGPMDADRVLRISSGVVGHRVTGLEPQTEYVVRGTAMGDGSSLVVKATDGEWEGQPAPVHGTTRGQVRIDSERWAATPDLEFTTGSGETEVWLLVWDDDTSCEPVDPDDPESPCRTVPASEHACALHAPGETCVDDLGVFRASDVD